MTEIPIWKRLLLTIPTVIGVLFLTFVLSNALPGDPVLAAVGERADSEIIEAYRKKMGLDEGVAVRFGKYLLRVVNFDLGRSYRSNRLVGEELLEKFPRTLALAFLAMGFASVFGVALGFLSAYYEGSWLDKGLFFFCTALISFPVFWFGMLLIFIFGVYLRWLPVGGMDHPLAIVLPALTLGARSLGYLVRLTRTTILEVLSAPYILTVRAKGGGGFEVFKASLRNALLPILTFVSLDFGSYLNGSVLTESVFAWDGMGRYAITGIFQRDYPVVLGTVLFGSMVFIAVNLGMDLLYGVLNPRLRSGKS